jgi:type II secretory ATPase GspE/PulE/Tfp pilus assembly ATPase PilB-like protein
MIPNEDPKLKEQLAQIWQQSEERLTQQAASRQHSKYLDLTRAPIQLDALKRIPQARAKEAQAVFIEHKGQFGALAAIDPNSAPVLQLQKELNLQGVTKLNVFEISKESLDYALGFYQFIPKAQAGINTRVDVSPEKVAELQKELVTLVKVDGALQELFKQEIATGEILNVVLAGGLTNRASDIHFETSQGGTARLRYRIDGELQTVTEPISKDIYHLILLRIKLLCNLRLNVNNISQDGRFTIALGDLQIELRVAIAPSEFGEAIVMRILDPRAINITLPQLGLRPDDLVIVDEALKMPNGMVLNTGPTGSGKTTTLYAFLRTLATPDVKIITIEDPIEYHLSGIEQTQVDDAAGYTFANGLRSMMRQDPDMILVGEIRDKETVEIALQAALTGHLVFSTLHTNSSAGVIPRMLDLGAQPVSIGPALRLVIAQRLVRKLCTTCKVAKPVDEELKGRITKFLARMPVRLDKKSYEVVTEVYEKKEGGCDKCSGTGYKGRSGIYELLKVDEAFEPLIQKHAGEGEINKFSREQGIIYLQEDGILRVISGQTSFAEIENVTGPLKDF